MIWNLFQQFEIDDAKRSAKTHATELEIHAECLENLRRQVDRLTLASQAMWELLRDRSGITEEQLYDKILEVDARDGKMDGKIPNEVISCPHCKMRTNTRRMRCVCCGEGIRPNYPFKA